MFDKLKIILNDKTLESQKSEDYEDKDEDYEDYEDYEDKDENKNKNENENENKNDDDKTIDQNKIIKGLNDILDEIIDKSKSFKEQIESKDYKI